MNSIPQQDVKAMAKEICAVPYYHLVLFGEKPSPTTPSGGATILYLNAFSLIFELKI
jgi:hypothetical protein